MEDHYTEEEMAAILGISKATLQKNRSIGRKHPPARKIGARVFYPKKEFQAWVKAQRLQTEVKAG